MSRASSPGTATILTARAYQLPAVPAPERMPKDFVFAGPLVRRISAEQFIDALAQFTGVNDRSAAAKLNLAEISGRSIQTDFSDRPAQPKWIWSHDRALQKAEPATVYFRRFIELKEAPSQATLSAACDNSFKVYVNGVEAGSGQDFKNPSAIDLRPHLRAGINLIAVAARNAPGAPAKPEADQSSPAGLWMYAEIRSGETVLDFGSDAHWLCALDAPPGWEKPAFPAALWNRAAELGGADAAPWNLGTTLAWSVSNLAFAREARAALANNDPLMTALGRSNREQVVTTRASAATTLQALELTNGPILSAYFRGAAQRFADKQPGAEPLITGLFLQGLARPPSESELEMSAQLLGSPVRADGVEDLLWAMSMLPEFQLIY